MLPALAHADDSGPLVDAVIVTAHPDPEDPPVVADARRRLSQTPGAAAVISAEAYRDRYAQGPAETLRDVPGVYAQKKWGDDTRLSIRGSGIGNPNHNRGTLLAQDGVPFNEADGYGDFQQIDPMICPLHRGLQGRQRPALRRRAAGQSDQHGDADRQGRRGGPDGISVFVEARNLADERYVSNFSAVTDAQAPSVSKAVFFPGEGR